jgi:DNA-binding transcriptional ArsR family regulator
VTTEGVPPVDPKRIRALGDKMRIGILQLLDHRLASAAELAHDLRISQDLVNYHLEVLMKCDCIEVAAKRSRGGRNTRFYTAKAGIVWPSPELELPVEREPITKDIMRAFACKAGLALGAGASNDGATATFAVETLTLTEPHRLSAHQALRLTVANLRGLHEQSRQLSIATDTPLIPIEIGIAMFDPPASSD